MDAAGEKVTSPFGVDRTGRGASPGHHLGLDLVNSQGWGAPIRAGVSGVVTGTRTTGTRPVFVRTNDGRQIFAYLHGKTVDVKSGDVVTPDTQVISMGNAGLDQKGTRGTHLHLVAMVRGDVIAAAGAAAGRVWLGGATSLGDKRSSPLSASALTEALEKSYYIVNPETFLPRRVRISPELLTVRQYAAGGFSSETRPDGLTLTPTCTLPDSLIEEGTPLVSANGGSAETEALADEAQEAASGEEQVQAVLATAPGFADPTLLIEYGQSAIFDLYAQQIMAKRRSEGAGNWAALTVQNLRLVGN